MFAEDIYGPLRAIAMACSTDKKRPHLNSVLFEITNERVRIVATDGHLLGLCDVAAVNGALGTFLIPLATVQAALGAMKSLKKSRASMRVAIGADIIMVGGVSIAYAPACEATKFPPYVEVLPKGEPNGVPRIGFTGALLARVGGMFDAIGQEIFALDFRGALDPVDCTNELCGLRVVLMPARV